MKRLAWICVPLLGILCTSSGAQEKELTQEQIQALAGKPCSIDEVRPGQAMVGTEAAGKRTTKTGAEKVGPEKTGIWRLQGSFKWKKTTAGLKGDIAFTAVCR